METFALEGIEAVGAGTLLTALVALFGVAVNLLTKSGDRSEARYQAEIDRLRIDKDAEYERLAGEKDDLIRNLRAELKDAYRERDLWWRQYAQATGRPAPGADEAPPR